MHYIVQAYSLDCYFRQSWTDPRLSFNSSGLSELALNWYSNDTLVGTVLRCRAFLAKIWVPDTFIVNGKQSFLHKITVPNRFVRISPDGQVGTQY